MCYTYISIGFICESLFSFWFILNFWEEFALFYHEGEHYPEAFVQRIKNVQMPGGLYNEFIKNNKPMYASFEEFLNDALEELWLVLSS